MDKRRITQIVKFFRKCLEQKINVIDVIIFGSQTLGQANRESDIDVAVISEDFKGKDMFKRGRLVVDAHIRTTRKFLVPMDILTLTPKELASEDSLAAAYVK